MQLGWLVENWTTSNGSDSNMFPLPNNEFHYNMFKTTNLFIVDFSVSVTEVNW
jgi:hypothetical protein